MLRRRARISLAIPTVYAISAATLVASIRQFVSLTQTVMSAVRENIVFEFGALGEIGYRIIREEWGDGGRFIIQVGR